MKHFIVNCILVVVYLFGCPDLDALFSEELATRPADTIKAPEQNSVNATEWPFVAWIDVKLLRDKVVEKGVSVVDVENVMQQIVWKDVDELRNMSITSISGGAVRLREIADVNVILSWLGVQVESIGLVL